MGFTASTKRSCSPCLYIVFRLDATKKKMERTSILRTKKPQSKDLGQVVRNSKFWYSCMFSKQTQFHSVLGYACYDKENISYMFPVVNKTHFLPTYNHSPAWTKIDLHQSDPHTNNIYKKI